MILHHKKKYTYCRDAYYDGGLDLVFKKKRISESIDEIVGENVTLMLDRLTLWFNENIDQPLIIEGASRFEKNNSVI